MITTSDYSTLAGKNVIGPDGDKIGKIADVYESTDGSGLTFGTVTTGMFGGGASFFPLDRAELRGDDVVVPFSKDVVKDAPRVENDEELTAPEEQRLWDYYSGLGMIDVVEERPAAGLATDVVEERPVAAPATADAEITRSEERLAVGTEKAETGRARLRKYVTTEKVDRTVPVTHDEVTIEREPINDPNAAKANIGEEEYEVAITEEKPVVAKEAVPVERVRVGTEKVTEDVKVSDELRKEQIEVEDDTAYPTETAARPGVGADRR